MSKVLNEQYIQNTIEKVLREYVEEGIGDWKYDRVKLFKDPKVRSGKEWAEKGGNFAVKRNGRVYYVSRSIAVSLYCFCQNKQGEWCVLANQRGPGAPSSRGLWNVPCGYLDYGESTEEAAAREAWEETGAKIPVEKLKMQGINSHMLSGAQNVAIRYAAVLDGTTDQYPLSYEHCEPGEVTAVGWIPLTQVGRYQWMHNQGLKAVDQAKTSLNYVNGKIQNDLPAKINSLKNELKGNPYASQLFNSILQDLKGYKAL